MQVTLADFMRATPEAIEAESILRKCVHCGFCNATCPTYQLLGDELDGPRGRIYLMKQMLEGSAVTARTQLHLDRCLSCGNCDITCPSGVEYGRLADIGRKLLEDRVARPTGQRLTRWALREGITRPALFEFGVRLGRLLHRFLPRRLRDKLPRGRAPGARPSNGHASKVILLNGCVQAATSPGINAATARVLDRLDVQSLTASAAGCCGAIRYHLSDHSGARDEMRRNIDAWLPLLKDGADAVVMTASGCGSMVKQYGYVLRHDPDYAEKAATVSNRTKDLSELLPAYTPKLIAQARPGATTRVAYHPPCTLQHGQRVRGNVEALLRALGVDVAPCADSHLCCGSAGTYSILQPDLAYRLRDQKLAHLQASQPQCIVSANVGCLMHLQSGTQTLVQHWIELVDEITAGAR